MQTEHEADGTASLMMHRALSEAMHPQGRHPAAPHRPILLCAPRITARFGEPGSTQDCIAGLEPDGIMLDEASCLWFRAEVVPG
jgi:hypothetical protein